MHFPLNLPGYKEIILKMSFFAVFLLSGYPSLSQEMKELFKKRQMALEQEFMDSSIMYKVTVGLATKKLPKAKFGEFMLLDQENEMPVTINKEKNKDVFQKYSLTTTAQKAVLTITYKKQDTLTVNIIYERVNEKISSTLFGSLFSNDDPEDNSWNICKGITISLQNDSASSYFIPQNATGQARQDELFGTILSSKKNIEIYYSTGMQGMKRLYVGHPTGLLFKIDDKLCAAYQFEYNKYVWLKNDLSDYDKLIIGAFLISYISLSKQ